MYLTNQEQEELSLLFASQVAERRKEKGLKLNYPEAVALISGYIIEGAREGKTVVQLIEECNYLLQPNDVMDGVAALLRDLQVEATFPDGTKLVSIHTPIKYDENSIVPGAYEFLDEDITLSAGRKRITITVINTSDRPIQVGSHYHFYEANPALEFDRESTKGFRLDIASGLAARFDPNETVEVSLVEYGGTKEVYGFSGKVNGPIHS
jgi:urease subunit gamma/beta